MENKKIRGVHFPQVKFNPTDQVIKTHMYLFYYNTYKKNEGGSLLAGGPAGFERFLLLDQQKSTVYSLSFVFLLTFCQFSTCQ